MQAGELWGVGGSGEGHGQVKAIIIQDTDARALLDKLKLESLKGEHTQWDDPDNRPTVASMHRRFHYIVCTWLQEQGADVVER